MAVVDNTDSASTVDVADPTLPLVGDPQPRWGLFNVITMAISFLLLFSGFNTASSYLTTALPQNIGFYSLSILYATFALANFISAAFVKRFGPRASMIFAAIMYLQYIAAAVKIIVPIYLISSALCGFGAAVLWTAQGSFLTRCSPAAKMSFHTGLFFAIFQANSLVGYPIAALLLHRNLGFGTIFAVLVIIATSGVVGLFVLRRVEPVVVREESITQLLSATVKLFKDPKILTMVAIIFYSGFSASFFVGGTFPKLMGAQRIAWAQMCYGVAEVIGSFGTGHLIGVVGRVPMLAFIFVTHLTAIILVYWSQFYSVTAVYFVADSMFGLGDSTLQTTIYSVLASLYPDKSESAFAYYKFSQAFGYTVCFLISVPLQDHLAVLVAILLGLLILSMIGMAVLQYKLISIDFKINSSK